MFDQPEINQEAKKVYDSYVKFRDNSAEWLTSRSEMEQRYFGESYSNADHDKGDADAPPIQVSDNRIRPAIKRKIVRLSGKPRGVVYGVFSQEDDTDTKLQMFLDYVAELSKAPTQVYRLASGQQKIGVGYLYLYDDPYSDYGFGDLKFKYLHYNRVFFDRDYESVADAPEVIIRNLLSRAKFEQLYPSYNEKTVDGWIYDNDEDWTGTMSNAKRDKIDVDKIPDGIDKTYVLVLEHYSKRYEKRLVVRSIYGSNIETIKIPKALMKYDEINDDNIDKFMALVPLDMIKEIEARTALLHITTVPVMYRKVCVADKAVITPEEEMFISRVPVFESVGEETRNGHPVGEVDFAVDQQDIINAALNIVLANAGYTSIPNWAADMSKIFSSSSEDDLRAKMQQFGSIINMTRDPMTGKWPIERLDVGQIDPAFERVLAYAITSIQQATDSPDIDHSKKQQYMTQVKLDQDVDRQLLVSRTNLEQCLTDLYTTILEWAPYYYTHPKQIIIFNEDNDTQEVVGINQPNLQNGTTLITDITKIRAKFRVRPGSTIPIVSVEMAEMLMRLYEMTQNPIFVAEMLKYIPVANRKKLLEELDLVPQLQQQIEELSKQLQQQGGELSRQIQQNTELQKSMDVMRTSGKMDAAYTRYVADLKTELANVKAELKSKKEVAKPEK